MIVEVLSLVRWEWFKLRRRWMPWILLAILALVTQIAIWGIWFAFNDTKNTTDTTYSVTSVSAPPLEIACDDLLEGRGPDLSSEFQKLPDISQAQAEQMAQRAIGQCQDSKANQQEQLGDLFSLITSPGSIVFSLVLGQGLGLILVAILTSSVIGTEHSWGTVRPLLVKGVRRWHMLASKLAMVALAFAASLLVVGVLGLITGQLLGGLLSGTEGLENSSSWGDVAEVFGKAWFSVLPYAALVGLVTVATRSSATGMGVGLGYYFLEQIFVGIFINLFDWFQRAADFLLVYNIGAFMGAGDGEGESGGGGITIGGNPGDAPGELHAFLVLMAYVLVLGGMAFYLFQRRDIPGASRS